VEEIVVVAVRVGDGVAVGVGVGVDGEILANGGSITMLGRGIRLSWLLPGFGDLFTRGYLSSSLGYMYT